MVSGIPVLLGNLHFPVVVRTSYLGLLLFVVSDGPVHPIIMWEG